MTVCRARCATVVALLTSALLVSSGVASATSTGECDRRENAKKFRCLEDSVPSKRERSNNGAPEGFGQFDSGGGDGSSFGGGGDSGGGPM